MVSETDLIFVDSEFRWVGRGAKKLLYALESFGVDPHDKIAFDAGASTGGFTQVLLEKGAKKVVAVDVGKNQLDLQLRNDPRVVSFEKVNIKNIQISDRELFLKNNETFEIIVGDLSFISLTLIIPKLVEVVSSEGTQMLLLVKPQFEVSHKIASKFKGVIKDPQYWIESLKTVYDCFVECSMSVKGAVESPIKGGSGNTEFFLMSKADGDKSITFEQVINTLRL